jgi:acylphosphatase
MNLSPSVCELRIDAAVNNMRGAHNFVPFSGWLGVRPEPLSSARGKRHDPGANHPLRRNMNDKTEISTFRVRVEGFVQAVGYRNFTIEEARKHGLDGWVRNRSNGDVEMLIHGEESAVNAFITACTHGPEGSRVKSIDLEKAEPPEEKGFHRRPSL